MKTKCAMESHSRLNRFLPPETELGTATLSGQRSTHCAKGVPSLFRLHMTNVLVGSLKTDFHGRHRKVQDCFVSLPRTICIGLGMFRILGGGQGLEYWGAKGAKFPAGT